jgi:hypothetical protein
MNLRQAKKWKTISIVLFITSQGNTNSLVITQVARDLPGTVTLRRQLVYRGNMHATAYRASVFVNNLPSTFSQARTVL